MVNTSNWLDELLEQVASGRMLPQDALQRFFMHKKAENSTVLSDADNAFISAMDAVEVAQLVTKWCARSAAAQGGAQAIEVDLRRPTFFHPNRRPPLVTGTALSGKRIMLFSADDAAADSEHAQDCLHVSGSFACAEADPAFLPVFSSALTTALAGHGLPKPSFIR